MFASPDSKKKIPYFISKKKKKTVSSSCNPSNIEKPGANASFQKHWWHPKCRTNRSYIIHGWGKLRGGMFVSRLFCLEMMLLWVRRSFVKGVEGKEKDVIKLYFRDAVKWDYTEEL